MATYLIHSKKKEIFNYVKQKEKESQRIFCMLVTLILPIVKFSSSEL